MPIEHEIDHGRKLDVARAIGTLTDEEIFNYQREIWSRPDVGEYDELVDMSKVVHVAPQDFEFDLGRIYAIHRGLASQSTKEVRVFRSMEEAVTWLGCEKEHQGQG